MEVSQGKEAKSFIMNVSLGQCSARVWYQKYTRITVISQGQSGHCRTLPLASALGTNSRGSREFFHDFQARG